MAAEATAGSVVARVRQSDEGGRFYRDVTEYRIVQRPEPLGDDPDAVLLTLGEVQELLLAGGGSRTRLAALCPCC